MAERALYDYDVFVSYSGKDDELPAPYNQWVTRFYKSLVAILQHSVGREYKIYFAPRSSESNQHWDEIERSARNSRIFLAVVSPSYLARDWPKRELKAFLDGEPDSRRLFVAAATTIDKEAHPVLGMRTHARFYTGDQMTGDSAAARATRPLLPDTQEFFDQLYDLADSIKRQLAAMDGAAAATPQRPRLGPVLLAMTTEDLDGEREAMLRYLDNVGIDVLPVEEYPLGGAAFRQAFAEDLGRAKLFVQLLGPRPGRKPPDLLEGYVLHQAAAAATAGVPVMQWRSTALNLAEITDPGYRTLLTAATVTASTLEQFKGDVRQRIIAPPVAKPHLSPVTTDGARPHIIVFVHAEKADEPAAQRILEELGSDYSVFTLDQSSSAKSLQEEHGEKLKACTALLLLYGNAGPRWVDNQMLQTVKTLGRDLPQGAVCIGPPPENPPIKFAVPRFKPLDCREPDGNGWRMDPIREFMAQFV